MYQNHIQYQIRKKLGKRQTIFQKWKKIKKKFLKSSLQSYHA